MRGDTSEGGVLAVQKTGSGTGSISSTPAGIDCGQTCSKAYPAGTRVTLRGVGDRLLTSSMAGREEDVRGTGN